MSQNFWNKLFSKLDKKSEIKDNKVESKKDDDKFQNEIIKKYSDNTDNHLSKIKINKKSLYYTVSDFSNKSLALKNLNELINDDGKIKKKLIGRRFILGESDKFLKKKSEPPIKKLNVISNKKIKKLKLFDVNSLFLKNSDLKYNDLIEINNIWIEYITGLIVNDEKNNNNFSIFDKILRADFNGAIIKIIKSNVKSYIGIEGLVVKETMKIFILITKENKVLKIIKENIVFSLKIKQNTYEIFGVNLVLRPEDRPKNKYKWKTFSKKMLSFVDLEEEFFN